MLYYALLIVSSFPFWSGLNQRDFLLFFFKETEHKFTLVALEPRELDVVSESTIHDAILKSAVVQIRSTIFQLCTDAT